MGKSRDGEGEERGEGRGQRSSGAPMVDNVVTDCAT